MKLITDLAEPEEFLNVVEMYFDRLAFPLSFLYLRHSVNK